MASTVPEKKRRFRLTRLLLGLGGLLLVLVAAGVLFRTSIATWGARAYLEDQGVLVSGFEVTALSPEAVEIRGVALGSARELTIERLELDTNLLALDHPIESITFQGLELHLDVTGERPPLGSLQELVDRLTAQETDGAPQADSPALEADGKAALPDIVFKDSRIVVETPSGPMTAELEGTFSANAGGALQGQATLALDSDLGRLKADLDARRGADGGLELSAEISEGRFAWEGFELGAVNGSLAVTQAPGAAPRIDADLDLKDLAYTPAEKAPLRLSSGRLTARGSVNDADVNLVLDGTEEHLDLTLKAQQAAASGGQQVSIELDAEIRTAGGLAQFLPLPEPNITAGTLVLQAEGSGSLAGDPTLSATWSDPAALLSGSRLRLQGDVLLGGVTLSDGTSGVSAHLPLVTELADNALTFTLTQDAAVRIERPTRDRLAALGVPADLLPLLVSGLNLTLAAGGERAFHVTARPAWPPETAAVAIAAAGVSDQGLRLDLATTGDATLNSDFILTAYQGDLDVAARAERLSQGGREIRKLAVTLPLTAGYDGDITSLSLRSPGSLSIGQLAGELPLRLEQPLAFKVTDLNLETAFLRDYRKFRLRAEAPEALLKLTGDGDPTTLNLGPLNLSFGGVFDESEDDEAWAEFHVDSARLPDRGIATGKISGEVDLDRGMQPLNGRFGIIAPQLNAPDPLVAPLILDGSFKRAKGGYDVTAVLWLGDGATGLADLTGRYADDGTATVKAVSRLLSFAPDGLQPGDISPLLADLEEVRGGLTATAQLAWPRNPAAESGRFTLSQLSFTGQGVAVSGLDLDLTLDSLQPLASAPAQKLTIAALEAGVPVENVAVTFSMDQSPGPQLNLEDGGFDLAGARWRIEPTRFDPAAESNRVVLTTQALDLATFFELIEIDGLSGRGTLQGRLPIVLAGGDVIIEDGHFEAEGPGALSLRFEALSSALASGGETVELHITDANSSCLIVSPGADSVKYVVMPMRL